ncbi:hypothetical protein C8F01DRAFT_1366905 [Mycena amicta]|nr:hypothetical protein C8F01DRAFT_1366905 [Mycena amicta]
MVCDDDAARNSLGVLTQSRALTQFAYGEDGMDGAFIVIEKQNVDSSDKTTGPGVLQIGLDDSSLELQAKLDEEYGQLFETVDFFHLLVTLQSIAATQRRQPSDFNPAYTSFFAGSQRGLQPACTSRLMSDRRGIDWVLGGLSGGFWRWTGSAGRGCTSIDPLPLPPSPPSFLDFTPRISPQLVLLPAEYHAPVAIDGHEVPA